MSISPAEYSTEIDEVPSYLEVEVIDKEKKSTKSVVSGNHYYDALQHLRDAVSSVSEAIAPVWPLKDYVAVNPYLGLADRSFLNAGKLLQAVSDCEVLMPLAYFQEKYRQESFSKADIEDAVQEFEPNGMSFDLSSEEILNLLENSKNNSESGNVAGESRHFYTIAEIADKYSSSNWKEIVTEEIGRHLSAYYDEGMAVWQNPHKDLPLYQAWHSTAKQDRRLNGLGLPGFCEFVSELPVTPEAAIAYALNKLNVPEELWETFLLCQAHSIPGWSAWAKYQVNQNGTGREDFAALLAIRLVYDVAVSKQTGVQIGWASLAETWKSAKGPVQSDSDALVRFVLLRASEIAFEKSLLETLDNSSDSDSANVNTEQPLAQMVFCIDVRSERYRRNLEATATNVQTFGFAGFFGVPMAYQALGEISASPQVPALLSPQWTIHETVRGASTSDLESSTSKRHLKRSFKNVWKQFQNSAVSCFAFVETVGLGFSWKLFAKSLFGKSTTYKYDGVANSEQSKLGPDIQQLSNLGLSSEQQSEMAESILRGIGITENFAKLVVFCGHASSTENNPLQAGLDCGACCGHSGEPNARIAAMLLNQADVRSQLAERGIQIPEETKFVAAVHDTTSDKVSYFDLDCLSDAQQQSLNELQTYSEEATGLAVLERMPHLEAESAADVLKRSSDWSEVRPEWGLAGNAAFIVAPRSVTKNADLAGRSFLHSYDYQNDPEFKVLEQIMTAPMVVAHWINMQYYASSVDNKHYGSGSKTIHNVVGKFGLFSGNGGDLTTGLPLQSIHDGTDFYHQPLRLLSVIAAPREEVTSIVQRNKVVEDLLINGWLNLVVLDQGDYYRFTAKQAWKPVNCETLEKELCDS